MAIKRPSPSPIPVPSTPTEAELNRRRRDYVVYPIIPRNEITLIGGPIYIGKTSLLIQMYGDFLAGKPVLGFESYPGDALMMIAAANRGATRRIARRTGTEYDDLTIRVIGTDGKILDFAKIAETEKRKNPDLQIIFFDGFYRLLHGNKIDYDEATRAVDLIQATLERLELTLVTTARITKLTAQNEATPAVERIYGSIGLTERIGTFISIQRPHGVIDRHRPDREIVIETQDCPMVQFWQFTHNGILVPRAEIAEAERQASTQDDAEMLLSSYDEGTTWTSGELQVILTDAFEISDRQAKRYIEDWLGAGKLDKPKWGTYRLPRAN